MRKKTSCNRIMRVVICFFVILGLCTWISRFTKSVLTPDMENKNQMQDFKFSDNDIQAAENMYQKTLKEQTPDMWMLL